MIDFLPIILIALITLIIITKRCSVFRTPFLVIRDYLFLRVVVFFFVVRVEPVIFLAICWARVLAK